MVRIAETCLNVLYQHGLSSAQFQFCFERAKHDLLANDMACDAIVAEVMQSMDDHPDAATLFGLLLAEARMGIENDSPYGKAFLENAEKAVKVRIATGTGEPLHRLKIAGLYRRAGLPVPDILMLDPVGGNPADEIPLPDLDGALAALAADVEAEGGGAYEFFSGLDEMSAGMPEDAKAAFVHHLLSLDNPFLERCALYWLVSGASLTREAVAAGLRERLMRGKLGPETLSYLPIIRGWLPASSGRAVIDDIGKLALRQGLAADPHNNRAEPIVSDIMATTADGVGAQGLTIVGRLQAQTFVAMILLKTGYGIKDAFVIRCRSKREATNIVSYARQEANSVRIDRMTAELLLEAALADGIENGHPPAPGFIDVMEACSLNQLRPQERDLQALLDHVDPQKEIQNATAAQLDRMLRNEPALDALVPFTDSWFEDTGETRGIIQGSRSARTVEKRIWAFLEGRRDIWARRFLQTAIILKSAKKERLSKALAAAAFALMHKHPLQDIPLVEDIVVTTLDAGGGSLW
ncbi:hypothetical protein CN233_24210 [Sinorhizobium meliloti]|uniref:hypothetical protein n=1 Tax=Rhizobium meliloti TaxID=382 RepID=UPI000FDBFA3B|nr:hypothetical protein [Sinorhizobium meliloti]RVG26272.1 hypothetical protein CN233_24210 [Sinorhizobium meliloti]